MPERFDSEPKLSTPVWVTCNRAGGGRLGEVQVEIAVVGAQQDVVLAGDLDLAAQVVEVDAGAGRVVRVVEPGDARLAEDFGAELGQLEAIAVAFAAGGPGCGMHCEKRAEPS